MLYDVVNGMVREHHMIRWRYGRIVQFWAYIIGIN